MSKLIKKSALAVYQNVELVLILFIISVISEYIGARIGNIIDPNFTFIINILLMSVNFYLWSSTITALIYYKKDNVWTWKEYINDGGRNFPFFVIWLVLILGVVNISIVIFHGLLNLPTPIGPLLVFLFTSATGYISAFIIVYRMEKEFKFKKILKKQAKYLTDNAADYILAGVYVVVVWIVSDIVINVLMYNAQSIDNFIIIKYLLILLGNLIRMTTVVVIMSTIVYQIQLVDKNIPEIDK
ncbi:MAG: hypothetical protein ACQEQC_05540 [Elusimicrobiota bacterium]